MTLGELLQSIGLNPEVMVAGGMGGLLRALSRRRFKFREAILAPVCGLLAASYLTLPAVQYVKLIGLPLPDDPQMVLGAAFLIGTSAMWICDFIAEVVWRRFVPKEPESE